MNVGLAKAPMDIPLAMDGILPAPYNDKWWWALRFTAGVFDIPMSAYRTLAPMSTGKADGTVGPESRLAPWTSWDAWRIAQYGLGAACAYHGYKRHNGSVGWAIGWALLGISFFPIAPAVAVYQGFGKPAAAKPNRRKRTRRRHRR